MSLLRTLMLIGVMLASGVTLEAQQTALPANPHGTLPQGMDCSSCHTTANWKTMRSPMQFNHATETKYPLTGRHATASCGRCHIGLRFDEPKIAQATCSGCHVDVHRGSIAGSCARCHNSSDFHDVEAVALHRRTGFPLVGAHLQAPCESCHRSERNGAFTAVNKDCISCHRQALASVTTVDHSTFPTDCSSCHVPFTWTGGAKFDHVTVSRGFALTGMHLAQPCAACHTVPGFALKFAPPPNGNSDCVACHRPDYVRVHGNNGYPTTCADCHTVNGWNANFNHAAAANGFALVGAHSSRPCSACHTQPSNALKFSPKPTSQNDCVACHRPDYVRGHQIQGYPTTCTDCHTVNNWTTNFNHDSRAFPINSGAHRGRWSSCATCHTAPTDVKVFSCLNGCHSAGATTPKHSGVNGYTYDSPSCYRCHPQGKH